MEPIYLLAKINAKGNLIIKTLNKKMWYMRSSKLFKTNLTNGKIRIMFEKVLTAIFIVSSRGILINKLCTSK